MFLILPVCPAIALLPPGELRTSGASCDELTCYFGAACVQKTPSRAECSCNLTCPDPPPEGDAPGASSLGQEVCGTDGQTYRSACQLRLFACRDQRDITVDGFGRCAGEGMGCYCGALLASLSSVALLPYVITFSENIVYIMIAFMNIVSN